MFICFILKWWHMLHMQWWYSIPELTSAQTVLLWISSVSEDADKQLPYGTHKAHRHTYTLASSLTYHTERNWLPEADTFVPASKTMMSNGAICSIEALTLAWDWWLQVVEITEVRFQVQPGIMQEAITVSYQYP